MKNFRVISVALMALALTLATGCTSSGRAKESEKAVQSMQDMQENLVKAKADVDRTVVLLGQLEEGTDQKKVFSEYTDSVKKLQAAGENAKKRGEEMKAKREEFLAKWDKELAEVQNPEVKKGLEQRREEVKTKFGKLTEMAVAVRDAYTPFMADTTDVQKALSVDLSPSGVAAIKPAIEKAKADGAVLGQKIDSLANELAAIRGNISPDAGAK